MDEPDLQLIKFISAEKSPINYSRYRDPTLDDLYERQSRETNAEQRKQLVWEFERRLGRRDGVPAAHLWWHRIIPHATTSRAGRSPRATTSTRICATSGWPSLGARHTLRPGTVRVGGAAGAAGAPGGRGAGASNEVDHAAVRPQPPRTDGAHAAGRGPDHLPLMRVVPGDVVTLRYAAEGAFVPKETLDAERVRLGLHLPLWRQFVEWLWGAVRAGLRRLHVDGAADRAGDRDPAPAEHPAGADGHGDRGGAGPSRSACWRRFKQDTWVDYAVRVFSVGGLAMPSFWLASSSCSGC